MPPFDKNFSEPIAVDVHGREHLFDIDDPDLPDWVKDNALSSGDYPYDDDISRKEYEKDLEQLQIELVKLQYWLKDTGNRIISIYEGRDAAGKGGSIKAIRQYMSPRQVSVVALSKPSDREQTQWYFQRYVSHLPAAGEMVLFDRSWYNRAGVEPVMGFCTPEEHEAFLQEAPLFESALVRDGIIMFKFWLAIGREMQLKQFHQRRHDPLKIWKLSPMDIASLNKFDQYTAVRDSMLQATHTEHAPWTVIRMNDKKRGRLNMLRHMLSHLDYDGKDEKAIGKLDDKIVIDGAAYAGE